MFQIESLESLAPFIKYKENYSIDLQQIGNYRDFYEEEMELFILFKKKYMSVDFNNSAEST
jgi:hypothetical protein